MTGLRIDKADVLTLLFYSWHQQQQQQQQREPITLLGDFMAWLQGHQGMDLIATLMKKGQVTRANVNSWVFFSYLPIFSLSLSLPMWLMTTRYRQH